MRLGSGGLRRGHDDHDAPQPRNRLCPHAEIITLALATFFCDFFAARRAIFASDLENPGRVIEKRVQTGRWPIFDRMARPDFGEAAPPSQE
jgi:hypothetical protein